MSDKSTRLGSVLRVRSVRPDHLGFVVVRADKSAGRWVSLFVLRIKAHHTAMLTHSIRPAVLLCRPPPTHLSRTNAVGCWRSSARSRSLQPRGARTHSYSHTPASNIFSPEIAHSSCGAHTHQGENRLASAVICSSACLRARSSSSSQRRAAFVCDCGASFVRSVQPAGAPVAAAVSCYFVRRGRTTEPERVRASDRRKPAIHPPPPSPPNPRTHIVEHARACVLEHSGRNKEPISIASVHKVCMCVLHICGLCVRACVCECANVLRHENISTKSASRRRRQRRRRGRFIVVSSL